jgi:hypothetical protein
LIENEDGIHCARCMSHMFDKSTAIQFTTLEQFESFQGDAFGRVMANKMKTSESNVEEKTSNLFVDFKAEEKELNKISAKVFKLNHKK